MRGTMKIGRQATVAGVAWTKRTMVLDVETVSLNAADEKGALNAMTGRVVCIGMLIDDGTSATEIVVADDDEHRLITEFWRTVAPTDVIVGHNVQEFDLRFLRQRSWILGIPPSRTIDARRYYTKDVIDSLQVWTEWSGNKKGITLDALASTLGCGAKTSNGANVARWWAERDLESIRTYCLEDVRIAYRVYCRLTYQEPKPTSADALSVCAEESLTSSMQERDGERA